MSESVPARNVDWAMARTLAHSAGRPLPFQTVTLADALGQTLAEPVHALQAIPHYASSAMDGWALSGEPPWTRSAGWAAATRQVQQGSGRERPRGSRSVQAWEMPIHTPAAGPPASSTRALHCSSAVFRPGDGRARRMGGQQR